MVLRLYKLVYPNPRMLCVKFVEIGPVVVEKKILIFFLAISLLHVSPLGKRCALHLNKLVLEKKLF